VQTDNSQQGVTTEDFLLLLQDIKQETQQAGLSEEETRELKRIEQEARENKPDLEFIAGQLEKINKTITTAKEIGAAGKKALDLIRKAKDWAGTLFGA
jgi:hypothetical protein